MPRMETSEGTARAMPKRGGFSARLPESLHDDLQAVATATGQSLNAVVEEAFLHYVSDYVGGQDFNDRAMEYRNELTEVERWTAAGAEGSSPIQRSRRSRGTEATVPIAVRVPMDLERQMRNVTFVLGVSLNDVIVESIRQWVGVEHYPSDDRKFLERALQNYLEVMAALERVGFEASPDDALIKQMQSVTG